MATKTTDEKPTSARLLPNRPLDAEKDDAEVRPADAIAEEPKQQELLAMPEEATRPIAVQNGRILATYVGLGLERDKDNEKLVHLDFSFPLEAAHDGYIPKKVKEAWEWMSVTHNTLIKVAGIPPVTLDIFLDPKEKKPVLHLVGAEFSKAIVQVVEEVGKGKAKLVTRFALRLRVEREPAVIDFGAWHDGEEFWITMPKSQEEIS